MSTWVVSSASNARVKGVDVAGIRTDPVRLTSLVLLGIRDEKTFPLIFYRDNCADSALDEGDIDPAYIESAKAVLVSGTHFARENTATAQLKAVRIARTVGRKVVFDIDYRPNLWGLAGHGAGEERYIKSGDVTRSLAPILPQCDLIVGTEEEMMVAGGADDPLNALRKVRAASPATLVLKRGPMGCAVFPGPIPSTLDEGIKGPGFPVEVYNVLGAGDAFMSGFLRGWLCGEPLEICSAYANANGAFAVSRLLCSAEYPTWAELSRFLKHGSRHRALRQDQDLNHIHWASTRRPEPKAIMAFAIDHRAQLEEIADQAGQPRERISAFKLLAVEAAEKVAAGRSGFGMLLDGKYGREALFRAVNRFWIGRPVEEPGSRPLDFEFGGSLAAKLLEWPVGHTIKCLCFYHPDDSTDMKVRQERELLRLYDAARALGRELLIEIIASKHGPVGDDTTARVIARLYTLGIKPDWWKLEAQPSRKAWASIADIVRTNDPLCRGVLLLGLDAPEEDLAKAFSVACDCDLVKGFAVGRTIFGQPATDWFASRIDDREAVDRMAAAFGRLCTLWTKAAERTPNARQPAEAR